MIGWIDLVGKQGEHAGSRIGLQKIILTSGATFVLRIPSGRAGAIIAFLYRIAYSLRRCTYFMPLLVLLPALLTSRLSYCQ